eukprot:CAMPEP_0180060838 /NCGR_PEP_ID=MMETSP0985-20121206/6269_1 /TAXON_ID=483367 /ORGANISM="non described non described, Strain CCMP 2436" /LENGTH=204 /DNA_ID=CAMNT_0021990915 /DNA_START=126 /DNA_END=740 /DNA_ORIENTATION=+
MAFDKDPLESILTSVGWCESMANCFRGGGAHIVFPLRSDAAKITIDSDAITMRHATKAEVAGLHLARHPKLHALPEDDLISTRHFGAFTKSGECVCCCTYLASALVGHSGEGVFEHVLQLRGVSTAEKFERQLLASTLLKFAEEVLRHENRDLPVVTWTKAYDRREAMIFFESQGWKKVTSVYSATTEVAEPHLKMEKQLGIHA